MQIGKVIKQIRAKRDLSQFEVARRSGLSLSTVHGIECGDNQEPSFRKIAAVCAALDLSLDELQRKIQQK